MFINLVYSIITQCVYILVCYNAHFMKRFHYTSNEPGYQYLEYFDYLVGRKQNISYSVIYQISFRQS